MKISINKNGYQIENDSDYLMVESQGLGGKATIKYHGDELMIKVKLSLLHFITPQFVISKNGNPIGKITRKYFGGNFRIQFNDKEKEYEYLLKTGSKKFDLVDTNKQPVLSITKDFSWSDFENKYVIEKGSHVDGKPDLLLLAFYAVFCVNYYLSTGGNTIAG